MKGLARLRPSGPPEPIVCDPPEIVDARLADVLTPKARLFRLYEHAIWTEGPAWSQEEAMLVFSDIRGRQVLGWREDGAVDVLIDATSYINGNAIAADRAIYHCEHGRRAISRTADGMTEPIIDSFEGAPLNSPNDLTIAQDGAVWFTDPTFGLTQPEEGFPGEPRQPATGIYRWDGSLRRMATPHQPNGIGFSPDGRMLYVSETPKDGAPQRIIAYDWNGRDLSGEREFARVENGIPDGFAIDARGWLWSSSTGAIEVFATDGRRLGRIPTPGTISNCTFDSEERRLFCTGGSDLLMLDLR